MVPEPAKSQAVQLPLNVVTRSDIGRLLREAEAIEDFLAQAAIRKPGTSLQLPKAGQLLEELVSLNKLNMLQSADRQRIVNELKRLHSSGPVLHMSFAADPSALFLQRLITWLRQQIHPEMLLQIGLQPAQAAGCTVRSTNKYFDFSLRQRFMDKKELLSAMLREDTPPQVVEKTA